MEGRSVNSPDSVWAFPSVQFLTGNLSHNHRGMSRQMNTSIRYRPSMMQIRSLRCRARTIRVATRTGDISMG